MWLNDAGTQGLTRSNTQLECAAWKVSLPSVTAPPPAAGDCKLHHEGEDSRGAEGHEQGHLSPLASEWAADGG